MRFTRVQIIIVGAILALILIITLMVLGILPGLRKTEEAQTLQGELTIWGVLDSESVINSTIIAPYQQQHPNVKVHYVEKDISTYEEDLLNALAAGKGPDIFMVHNTWIPEHSEKLSSLTSAQLPIDQLRNLFPSIVEHDFTANSDVYALPLYIDTLALITNSELLDNAGVAKPPTTWEQFINVVPNLRKLDATNKIVQAGAAIGGSLKSVVHANDILSLLMLQEGVQMTSDDFTQATFARDGASSLRFYTSFANSASGAYTWSDALANSFDSFSQGKVGMIFAYGQDVEALEGRSPFLRIQVNPFPQPESARVAINYGSYWGLAVSNKSAFIPIAWNVIFAATSDPAINKAYLDASGRSPALRSLIDIYKTDGERGVFARQALTAKSWRQIDQTFVSQTFSQMIQSVLEGSTSIDKSLETAQSAITNLMRRKSTQ